MASPSQNSSDSSDSGGTYHIVAQGENLTSIAMQYGLGDYHAIYDHPTNSSFKNIRPNPDVLHPGDVVFIPPVKQKVESCSTDKRHRFQVKAPKKVLRTAIQDMDGKPIANTDYELVLKNPDKDDEVRKGKTDGNGVLEQNVPIDIETAELKVKNLTWTLQIGHLNPLQDTLDDGVSGAQARLRNLGFDPGPLDGIMGPRTRSAILVFQKKNNLTEDRTLNANTLAELKKQHGS